MSGSSEETLKSTNNGSSSALIQELYGNWAKESDYSLVYQKAKANFVGRLEEVRVKNPVDHESWRDAIVKRSKGIKVTFIP